jgi:hypothetical protein
MGTGQALFDALAVAGDMLLDLARGAEGLAGWDDRAGGQVGVRTGAVPVTLGRLGVQGRGDVVLLDRTDWADLELPLAGLDLSVDTGDRYERARARPQERLASG